MQIPEMQKEIGAPYPPSASKEPNYSVYAHSRIKVLGFQVWFKDRRFPVSIQGLTPCFSGVIFVVFFFPQVLRDKNDSCGVRAQQIWCCLHTELLSGSICSGLSNIVSGGGAGSQDTRKASVCYPDVSYVRGPACSLQGCGYAAGFVVTFFFFLMKRKLSTRFQSAGIFTDPSANGKWQGWQPSERGQLSGAKCHTIPCQKLFSLLL